MLLHSFPTSDDGKKVPPSCNNHHKKMPEEESNHRQHEQKTTQPRHVLSTEKPANPAEEMTLYGLPGQCHRPPRAEAATTSTDLALKPWNAVFLLRSFSLRSLAALVDNAVDLPLSSADTFPEFRISLLKIFRSHHTLD
jgi:hypothetical protein